MLPLLGLFSLALAASLWPDSAGDAEPQTASGDLSASGTDAGESGDDILNYASASSVDVAGELAESGQSGAATQDDTLLGTDRDDVLFGFDGDDQLSGGAGADVLNGGAGNDLVTGDDDSEGDELIGGDGDDWVVMGDGDTGTGGSGDDEFHMDANGTVHIRDYNPDDDRLMVYYDPAGPVPTLKTEMTETGMLLLADDTVVAVLAGVKELDLTDVHLLAEAA